MKNRVFQGYSPVAGEWYPIVEYPRPAVYHRKAKQDVYESLYPDLVTEPIKSIADVATALANSTDKIADVKLTADVTVPDRDDGKITTTFIKEGETLNIDLNGHEYNCRAYAFYVINGTLNITDSKGTGKITTRDTDSAAPAIYAEGEKATVTMDSGTIDTVSKAVQPADHAIWTYGVYCAKGAKFTMTGGTIHTDGAAGITVSNTDAGQWTGIGNFHITGNAHLIADNDGAVYQASQDTVLIDGNAVVEGGIIARMGHITVAGNAKIINKGAKDAKFNEGLGDYVTYGSGTDTIEFGFLGLVGCFTTEDKKNDLSFEIKDNATIENTAGREDVGIAKIESKYDQDVTVKLNNKVTYKVYEYEDLVELAKNNTSKRSMPAKKSTVNCTVTVGDQKVYPVEKTDDTSKDTSTTDTKKDTTTTDTTKAN